MPLQNNIWKETLSEEEKQKAEQKLKEYLEKMEVIVCY